MHLVGDETSLTYGLHIIRRLLTIWMERGMINEIEKGELIKIDVDIAPQTYYSQLIYHKNKWIAPYMESFIKLISDIRPESK